MKQILLVDDDVYLVEVLKQLLEDAGYVVLTASTGRNALAILTRQVVDLVITDVFMPEGDGLELLFALRQKTSQLKIMVMSGGDSRGVFDMLPVAKKLGACCTLQKPFAPEEFMQLVRGQLSVQ